MTTTATGTSTSLFSSSLQSLFVPFLIQRKGKSHGWWWLAFLFPSPTLQILPTFQSMDSSLHQILGAGFIADVILWRRRDVAVGVLIGTLGIWLLFEVAGYTLLSLVSNVLLLLISILFVWAKAAALLNRPPPPIPRLHFSEEFLSEAVIFVHSNANLVLSSFHDIALGKNSKLFYKVAACLWLISIFSCLSDLLTFGCTIIAVLLTVPALYEKYKDNIEEFVATTYMKMRHYETARVQCTGQVKLWILEKKKKI